MDDNEIRTTFRNKVKCVNFALFITIAGVILIIGGTVYGFASENMIIQSIGIIMFIGGILINGIVWRCPVCKKPLPRRQSIRSINYCSYCSAKLK